MLMCTIYSAIFIFFIKSSFGDENLKNEREKLKLKEIRKLFQNSDFLLEEEFHLEFNSNGELSIKGCDDIKEYCEDNVLLLAGEFIVTVKGTGLYLKQFSEKSTVIDGLIESINFIKR